MASASTPLRQPELHDDDDAHGIPADLSPEDIAELERNCAEAYAEEEAGELIDAADVLR